MYSEHGTSLMVIELSHANTIMETGKQNRKVKKKMKLRKRFTSLMVLSKKRVEKTRYPAGQGGGGGKGVGVVNWLSERTSYCWSQSAIILIRVNLSALTFKQLFTTVSFSRPSGYKNTNK